MRHGFGRALRRGCSLPEISHVRQLTGRVELPDSSRVKFGIFRGSSRIKARSSGSSFGVIGWLNKKEKQAIGIQSNLVVPSRPGGTSVPQRSRTAIPSEAEPTEQHCGVGGPPGPKGNAYRAQIASERIWFDVHSPTHTGLNHIRTKGPTKRAESCALLPNIPRNRFRKKLKCCCCHG